MIFPIEIIESDYFPGRAALVVWPHCCEFNIIVQAYNGIERDNDDEFIHIFVFFLLLRIFELFVKVKHKLYFLTAAGFCCSLRIVM